MTGIGTAYAFDVAGIAALLVGLPYVALFLGLAAVVALLAGPTSRELDARARNPRATAPDPWWRA